MKKSMKFRLGAALAIILALAALLVVLSGSGASTAEEGNIFGGKKMQTFDKTPALERLMATSNHYIVTKMKQLGGTHYAYTEAVAETNAGVNMYSEYNFEAGSSLVALSVLDNGDGTVSTYEKTLFNCSTGVVRDPSVSADGKRLLISVKKNSTDDFHIYEMDLTSSDYTMTQLTFGSGRADIEPQYLPNGNIVFSSTRDTQTVDCWITPVSNLYIMNGDGSDIRRVGYDQVHTTFPTVTSDGRVIYTRWDYNDRTQMYVQGIFQMFQDGTNQTEVWGNDADYPTTLLHSREIPGAPGKYVSIASGHHVLQKGKLCIVDTTKGREDPDAITMLFPDSTTGKKNYTDGFGQSGRAYKYPYAIDEQTFLVSAAESYSNKSTPYSIYLCDRSESSFGKSIVLVQGTEKLPACQIVPITGISNYNRPSTVNYAKSSGTYYVANVYEGESMEGVEVGKAKYLRVVEVVYRTSSIGGTVSSGGSVGGTADIYSPIATGNGSWDVKAVLGVVPVYEDGSALFRAPADTPIYFQLLDEKGCVIQTMRSWSTIMPNETASCVGCHEDKNTAPPSGSKTTMAQKKGVVDLQPDLWMENYHSYENFDPYSDESIGFSYTEVVQSIFDKSCITCHSDTQVSLDAIKSASAMAEESVKKMNDLVPEKALWNYSVNGSASLEGYAPFGSPSLRGDVNTRWTSGKLTATRTFFYTQYRKDVCDLELFLRYSGQLEVKLNGTVVYEGTGNGVTEKTFVISDRKSLLSVGENTIEISVSGGSYYFDCALRAFAETGEMMLVEKGSTWNYVMSSSAISDDDWFESDFDDSSWKSGLAPFGDRNDVAKCGTAWSGSNNYIYIRQEFDLTKNQLETLSGGQFSMLIFYDDTIDIYINGTKVFTNSGWVDSYTTASLTKKPENVLKEGKNVIAVSLHNGGGGREIDLQLTAKGTVSKPSTTSVFSLEGFPVYSSNSRMKRSFPLSYLFLTGSVPSTGSNQVSGVQFVGSSTAKYVKWNSSMTGAEKLPPYRSGAFTSPLILKLREGHGNLTENEIRAIECWIDLCVPCAGTYDENERFAESKEQNVYEENVNKREFYDTWDKYVKLELGGILPEATLDVTFTPANADRTGVSGSGKGYVILNYPNKYAAGDKLTVKVTGSNYIAISLNERQGESILYLPTGELTYTLSSDLASSFCSVIRPSGSGGYKFNTIFVRVPTSDELARERNLAENTYDDANTANAFPHVTGSTFKNEGGYAARCAVDGFTSNGSMGNWPYQAWSPAIGSEELKIDFGREVTANTLLIKLRAAKSDTHPLSLDVVFSDGSKLSFALCDSAEFFTFDLGGKSTTSITLNNFDLADPTASFGITEVRVLGK